MFKNIFYIFLLWAVGLSAQESGKPEYPEKQKSFNNIENSSEQELISRIEHASSKERILALCLYQERTGQNNLTPEKLDNLFKELDRIAAKDKEFKHFVDFYKRVSPTIFIPEKDKESTHRKMIELYKKTTDYYVAIGDDRFAGMCLVHSGFDWFMLGDYGNAIENMLRGYELLKKAGYTNNPLSPKFLHDMALVFIFFGEYEKVVELMEA